MIKVHTYTEQNNRIFYTCDFCGAGIGEQSPQGDIDTFVTDHTNCDNLKNTDLAFLDTDEEYIP